MKKDFIALLVGNEGLLLAEVAKGRVTHHRIAMAGDETALARLRQHLRESRKPVRVLVDILEQSYRKETLPPVSALDRGKLIQRRLDFAFPNVESRAALRLAAATAAEGGGRHHYLFAALPRSKEWTEWEQFINASGAKVASVSLLPVEAVSLVNRIWLSMDIPRDEGVEAAPWTLFVARQRTGGFRQIVTRDGELALTRLTPNIADAGDAKAVALEIAAEIEASLGYLKRLGYLPGHGLDIIVIGEEPLARALSHLTLPARHLRVISAVEAGRRLGLGEVTLSDSGEADLLLLAGFAKRRKPKLDLRSDSWRKAAAGRSLMGWAWASQALALLAVAVFALLVMWHKGAVEADTERIKRDALDYNSRYDQMQADAGPLPAGPGVMLGAFDADSRLAARAGLPDGVLDAVRLALGSDIALDELHWSEPPPPAGRRGRAGEPQRYTMTLTLNMGAVDDPAEALRLTELTADRLAALLPTAESVRVTRQPMNSGPEGRFTSSTQSGGTGPTEWARGRYTEITVTGVSAARPGRERGWWSPVLSLARGEAAQDAAAGE
jgi:hypothetical protein